MTVPSQEQARHRWRGWTASAVALAVGFTGLAAAPATAAPTDFRSSFEAADPAPSLRGTGDPVNVTGARFQPGSLLGQVTRVTAESENAPGEAAVFAADANASTKWLAFRNTGWLQYQLGAAAPLARYTLTSGGDAPERDPKNFRVQGSNDGLVWDDLDTRTNVTFGGRGETKSFELATPSAAYSSYRLDIQQVADPSKNILQLADFEPITVTDGGVTPSFLDISVGSGPTSSDTAKTGVGFDGVRALQYSGRHIAAGDARASTVLYENVGTEVAADSALSYSVFPVLDGEQTYAATFVAVDVTFTDGSALSTSGATDVYGTAANAAAQGLSNTLWPNQWNKVTVDLGAFVGKTVADVVLTYDHPVDGLQGVEVPTAATSLTGWIDDVKIAKAQKRDTSDGLVSYVDTRRGTNSTGGFSRGNNLPAAAWPNGFNFITPMTNADNVGTLYHYQRENNAQNLPTLNGIGLSHEPSIWMGDRNSLAVMPAAGDNPTSSLNGRKLAFRHENEVARPDLYSVQFENGIKTAVTPTDHGVVYRFTFTGDSGSVLVDQLVNSSKLSVDGDAVTGWVDGGSGYPGRTRMFVYGTFDRAPGASGATKTGDRNGTARYAAFDTSSDKDVELRLASSFISQDQAKANYGLELEGVSFEQAHDAVRDAWNERLSVVHDVKGATDPQLVNLYSSLYRLNLYPNSQFENTGSAAAPAYKYASPVSATTGSASDTKTNAKIVDGKIYVNNGFWDTYRTAWPLYSLLYPEVTEELVDGFVQQYRDGGWVARWSSPGYADLMTGTSSDVAFAEAYLAGALSTETALEAYDAALKNATVLPPNNNVGRKGLAQSIFLGYTEQSTHESASWGLEGFINDFGIAEMAAKLATDPKTPKDRVARLQEEATYFEARAKHYVEMFNPQADTFTARNADGTWTAGADFDKKAWGGAFTEASAWTFGYHAPHDVNGLAALYTGRQGLVDNMHAFLTERERADRSGIHEAREARDIRMGMLGMSNQVAHHIPYVLAEAGDVAGAQKLVRDIQKRLFVGSDIGQGYPGDEDNGEFSAWYVFSALGFYPLEVGSGRYTVGSPLFESATLDIDGKQLVVKAPGATTKQYVAGVSINGTAVDATTFDGALLRNGGTLEFTMSDTPSTWGTKDMGEQLDVPTTLVDATKPGRGELVAADGTPVTALVDDNMNSVVTFPGKSTDLVWTSQSGQVTVGQYTLTSAGTASAPSSWTLSGSNDGKTWTELDARTDEVFAWDAQTRPFSVASTAGYSSFKLSVTTGGDALKLAEVELFAKSSTADGLAVSAAPAQRVAVGVPFEGTIATVVGTEKDASGYTVTVDYGDGVPAAAKLTRDELGAWRVSAPRTFTVAATYSPVVTVTDSTGATASATGAVVVYRDDSFVGALNGVCIGDLGGAAANCDGQGYGYYRDKLAAQGFVQGTTIALPGTKLTYDLPAVAPGAPDSVSGEGQTFKLDLGAGATQLAFIGTATEKDREPTATLHFTDGTTQDVKISFGDWVGASGNPKFGNTVVAVSQGRLSGNAPEGGGAKNTAIYATAPITIATDADGAPKTVESLTMPKEAGAFRDGRVHVFAIASDGDRTAATPLTVTAAEVPAQAATVQFEAALATVTGGVGATTAVVNWGDGSPLQPTDVVNGTVTGTHTYAAEGTYTVTVTVEDTVRSAAASLRIAVGATNVVYDPKIQLSTAEAQAGQQVGVTGTGFAPNESVAVRIDDTDPVVVTATGAGAIDATITVPKTALDGDHPVIAVGDVSKTDARATLRVTTPTVEAQATSIKLTTTTTDAVAGESITLVATVTPAAAMGQVEFLEGDTVVGSATAAGGVATADVPVATSGAHTYVARFVPDDVTLFLASTSDPLRIEVRDTPVLAAELALSASSVVQGGSIVVTGRGYQAGEQVKLTLHSDPIDLATATADASGAFRIEVRIPATAPVGQHEVVAAGAASGLTAKAALKVTAEGKVPTGISITGTSVPLTAIGIVLTLLVLGAALLVWRRRRQA